MTDPNVFFKFRIDHEVLILDRAVGGDRERTVSHRDHQIGFSWKLPTFGELGGSRQVGGFAVRHALLDPVANDLLVGLRHVALIGERSDFRIGMPRRHSSVVDYLDHHVAPADRFVVVGQRKRTDVARVMTFDTVALQNASNLIAIGDCRISNGLSDSAQ